MMLLDFQSQAIKDIELLPGSLCEGSLSLECSHHAGKKLAQLGEAEREGNEGSQHPAPAAGQGYLATPVSSCNLGPNPPAHSQAAPSDTQWNRPGFPAKCCSHCEFKSKISNFYC